MGVHHPQRNSVGLVFLQHHIFADLRHDGVRKLTNPSAKFWSVFRASTLLNPKLRRKGLIPPSTPARGRG